MPQLRGMDKPDFEKILPIVLSEHIPVGVVGFLLAGLMAAFMSNFAATINAAPAYIVNDIYKRFINSNSAPKTEVKLSRLASLVVLVVGIAFGLVTTRITDVMMWIVGALYGGYVVANVLKWYWWRFNGYGYFWGMMAGILSAMVLPGLASVIIGPGINPLYTFPVIFVFSITGCFAGTLLTRPEDETTLMAFYKKVNPWGSWGPIRERVLRDDPGFVPNRNFGRDSINVVVGIFWQICLVLFPIYVVLRNIPGISVVGITLLLTTLFIKFNWYNKLEKAPV